MTEAPMDPFERGANITWPGEWLRRRDERCLLCEAEPGDPCVSVGTGLRLGWSHLHPFRIGKETGT